MTLNIVRNIPAVEADTQIKEGPGNMFGTIDEIEPEARQNMDDLNEALDADDVCLETATAILHALRWDRWRLGFVEDQEDPRVVNLTYAVNLAIARAVDWVGDNEQPIYLPMEVPRRLAA